MLKCAFCWFILYNHNIINYRQKSFSSEDKIFLPAQKVFRTLRKEGYFTMYTGSATQGPLHRVRYTGPATQCPLNRVRYTGSATQCPLHSVRYTGSATQCPLHRVRYTVPATQCPLHLARYTVPATGPDPKAGELSLNSQKLFI